jgi:hypothetical protein
MPDYFKILIRMYFADSAKQICSFSMPNPPKIKKREVIEIIEVV